MTHVHVLFGTESGNAEMVAEDVAAVLQQQEYQSSITELCNVTIGGLRAMTTAVFISSTYGEGGLPETSASFYAQLLDDKPDLTGLRFAAFGLGDSIYETYNNGIDTIREALLRLGAEQIGETAKHDAASAIVASDQATAWAGDLLGLIAA